MSGPQFLIIGAQKCGTTSLYAWLAQHPALHLSEPKEVHFFDQHFGRGEAWYRAHFRGRCSGEATPYYLFHPLAAARCAAVAPQVRLIVLLRDPVARALSHYHHVHRQGIEPLSFGDAVRLEALRLAGEEEKLAADPLYFSFNHQKFSYLARGCYADQLERWLEHFPREQLLILPFSQIKDDPGGVAQRAFAFLGVEGLQRLQLATLNGGGGYPPMNPALRAHLRDWYAPHSARLQALLGEDPVWEEELARW